MANVKIKVATDVLAAAKAYNLAGTGYNGVTNIYELLSAYAGVTLVANRQAQKDCSKNIVEKNFNMVNVNVGIDLWGIVVNDFDTNFSTLNAQLLFPMFVNAAYLDMSEFNLVSKYVATADRGAVPMLNVNPMIDKNFFQYGNSGMSKGMFGDNVDGVQVSRGASTVFKANIDNVWAGVQFAFDAVDANGGVIQSNFKAAVAEGALNLTHAAAAGSYTVGVWRLNEAVFKTATANNWLKADLNIANIANVNNVFLIGYVA